MTAARPVWVVASATASGRWASALDSAGIPTRRLAWSEIALVPGMVAALEKALAASPPDALLFTSPNAVPEGARHLLPSVPCACVGALTARVAGEEGLDVRWTGSGTGEDLARVLAKDLPGGRILFLRGAEVRPETVDRLAREGASVDQVVVYEARPGAHFPDLVRSEPEPAAFAVGSPRAAAALGRELRRGRREGLFSRPAAAMGPRTARALQDEGFETTACPEVPGLKGLVETVARLLRDVPSA